MTYTDQTPQPLPEPSPTLPVLEENQWLFQFQQHMLLTVQAIHRLREALTAKMP